MSIQGDVYMRRMTIGDRIKVFTARRLLSYVDKEPEKNLPRILDWLKSHDKNNAIGTKVGLISRVRRRQGKQLA